MTIGKVDQEVTYGPTIGPIERSDINAVRQVGGLAVARWTSMRWSMRWRSMRWKPKRRLMRRTGKFGVVAGGAVWLGGL